jgi:hypothetical protein
MAAPETRKLAASLILRAAGGEPVAGPRLLVLDGPLAGRRLPLGAEETLGRGPEATVRLPDPGASRVHARIRAAGSALVLDDLGSKNGLRVNGRTLSPRGRRLAPGDEILVGSTRLALEADPPPDPDEATGPPVVEPPDGAAGATARGAPDAGRRRRRALAAAGALLLAGGCALLAGGW